jgi:hypothetical protein
MELPKTIFHKKSVPVANALFLGEKNGNEIGTK